MSVSNSEEEYEIAHDFIADAFLNYSNSSSITRHVKNALDLYMTNYMEQKNEEKNRKRKEFNKNGASVPNSINTVSVMHEMKLDMKQFACQNIQLLHNCTAMPASVLSSTLEREPPYP